MPPLHAALAVLCTIIWGLNFAAAKFGLAVFPPFLFTGLRFAVASVPFLIFTRPPDIPWRWTILVGLMLGVGQFGLLFTGMTLGMPPGLSSTMMQTQPFFTMAFAAIFLAERPRWQNLAGLLLAFAGVLVIAGNLDDVPLLPFVLVIGAAAFWAATNVATRYARASDAWQFIVWVSAISPLPMFALSWIFEGQARIVSSFANVTWTAIGGLLFVAWVATNGAYGWWSWLLKRYPAATVAPYSLLVPIWGISAAMVLFDEPVSRMKWIGIALIVAGVAANSWPRRKVAASS
ncbi:MAG TPA: EamA family transporter [Magnetospirillaceae bacterium]|jgi:O-acetylserine/cysteine efflux transporter